MLLVKYVALGLGVLVWAFGLYDQLHSLEATATYLFLSIAMVVVALF